MSNVDYNYYMKEKDRKVLAYIIACVGEFARSTGLSAQDAFQYLNTHGGIDFLFEHYDMEHLLSLDDTVEDLKIITHNAGGVIA